MRCRQGRKYVFRCIVLSFDAVVTMVIQKSVEITSRTEWWGTSHVGERYYLLGTDSFRIELPNKHPMLVHKLNFQTTALWNFL